MTKTIKILTICVGAALPICASAQQGDAAYCSTLAQTYEHYVGNSTSAHRSQQRNATVDTAITQCRTNSTGAIAVIEKALKDARVDLPPRG
jgi:hypothetical protein